MPAKAAVVVAAPAPAMRERVVGRVSNDPRINPRPVSELEIVTESLDRMSATRVVVAHRLSTVRDADQIAVVDAGRIIELGSHEELMALGGHYRDLVERQL
jgi:ABC-type polar amino acid transport system ATPase subunit